MKERNHGGDKNNLKQRGADDNVAGHAEDVDQRRDHHKPAADPHDRRQYADHKAN